MLKQISLLFFCLISLLELSFVRPDIEYVPSDLDQREDLERSIASVTDLKTKIRDNEMAILKKIDLDDIPLDTGEEVVVAVLDTGINLTDGDLMNKIYKKNGQMVFKDFILKDDAFSIHDMHGHGTNISKIITTINPKVKILPIRVHDGFETGLKSYAKAIYWLVKNHPEVKVVNISASGQYSDEDEFELFMLARSLDINFIVSAGNDGKDISKFDAFPARYSLNGEFVVVGSLRDDGSTSEKSNYSNKIVDFAAHGERFGFYTGSQYTSLSGTSQSAAVISGVISQILSHRPNQTPEEIRATLQKYSSNHNKNATKYGVVSYRSLVTELVSYEEKFRNLASR